MLAIKDNAPDFSLKNQHGDTISLSDFKGKQIILYFYPKDDTPGCTRQAKDFSNNLEKLTKLNTTVVGISKDNVASHEHFCNKHNLTITLLSDEDLSVIQSYGVWKEKKNFGKSYMAISRTTFLISEKGIIQYIWNNVSPKDHFEKILKKLS